MEEGYLRLENSSSEVTNSVRVFIKNLIIYKVRMHECQCKVTCELTMTSQKVLFCYSIEVNEAEKGPADYAITRGLNEGLVGLLE